MIKNLRKMLLRTAAALTLLMALPNLAFATDLTYFKTVFDTDFESAGIGGMRGNGTGDITLSGVSGTVTEAYIFWHGPNNNRETNLNNQTVAFAGTDVTGDFLGVSNDNCWGFENSLAYRADVTSLVSGNGTFSLANFVKDGSDINGVSLVVFYDDGDDTNNRDIVMFDGNDSNINNIYDADGWNITLDGINYVAGDATAQFHVGDGQTFPDDALIANGTELAPSGPVFQGDTVPNAGFNQGLWDIRDFNVTSLLTPGDNSLNITTGLNSDCLACVMIAIDLPAGAAPDQPDPDPDPDPDPVAVPEPSTLFLLGLGLLGLAGVRRTAV